MMLRKRKGYDEWCGWCFWWDGHDEGGIREERANSLLLMIERINIRAAGNTMMQSQQAVS